MLIDTQYFKDEQELCISHTDEQGKRKLTYVPFKPYEWVEVGDNARNYNKEYKSVKHNKVKKVDSFYPKKHATNEFLFTNVKKLHPEIFEISTTPQPYFCDIEVKSEDGFPEPEDAKAPIVTIALSNMEDQVRLFTIKDLSKQQLASIRKKCNKYFEKFDTDIQISHVKFKNEYLMIQSFLKTISKISLLTGWYFDEFDWNYIYNRSKRLGLDPGLASPTGGLSYAGKRPYRFPSHCGIVDYQKIWAAYDFSIKVKENEKLDWVANVVLGLNKINYKGSLSQLYDDDFEKYCYYNIVDTLLVKYIHQKTDCLSVYLNFSYLAERSISDASSPVALTEGLLQESLYFEENIVFAKLKEKPKDADYSGGFVMEPEKGKHRATAAWDFSSLYPSIKRMYNVSVESYMGQLNSDTNKLESHLSDYDGLEFDIKTMIPTTSGAVYDRKESIMKKKLTRLYNQRMDFKGQMFKADGILNKLEQHKKTLVEK